MRQLVLPRSQPILDVALSPDGQTLAVAHRNYGVVLYDPFDGRVKSETRGNYSRLIFRDDGKYLLCVGPVTTTIFFDREHTLAARLQLNNLAYDAEFRSDNAVAIINSDGVRTVLLPQTGKPLSISELDQIQLAESRFIVDSQPYHMVACRFGSAERTIGLHPDRGVRQHVMVIFDPSHSRLIGLFEPPSGMDPATAHYITVYRRCDEWFAFSTNREIAVYNWSDLAACAPLPLETRRRGLFQTVRETLLGPSAETRYQHRYGSLPTLMPRFRVTVAGKRSADPLPVAFLPDGSGFLCRGTNAAIELRDTTTGQVRTAWQFQRAWPRVLAVAADGLTAIAAAKGAAVTFWDLE